MKRFIFTAPSEGLEVASLKRELIICGERNGEVHVQIVVDSGRAFKSSTEYRISKEYAVELRDMLTRWLGE